MAKAAIAASGSAHRRRTTFEEIPPQRVGDGESELDEGDVVHLVRGQDGAHKLSNPTDEPARYLMASNLASPDAVEYPDPNQLSVMAETDSQFDEPLWDIHTLEQDRGR